jgi:N-acetylglucosamine kinase-like BadF-type ATPase
MTLFAGIDGGQSSTVAVIADERGKILARGSAGPSDEIGQGPDSTRLRDALHGALDDARNRAGLAHTTRFASIVAGVSGYEGRVHGRTPKLPADFLALVHDSENAHAGALGGDAGVVVIAGTGSIGFARSDDGESALVGGWGFLFGDEGSAFWLARTALADAMRHSDRGEMSDLTADALQYFEQPSLRQISRGFYLERISRTQLASFAVKVLEAAERGNETAARYANEGAAALVSLAERAMLRAGMQHANVAFIGGMTHNAAYRDRIGAQMQRLSPRARLIEPKYDAAIGALILAYKQSGVTVPERIA